jgi:hypothetical protein
MNRTAKIVAAALLALGLIAASTPANAEDVAGPSGCCRQII